MVHTGRPSRGCAVCRRRRIKCDEKSPQCSYCIKTKQPCPGYKNQFDLAWRDQNTVAQKSVERRKRASGKRAPLDMAALSGAPKPFLTHEAMSSVPGSLAEDPETYSVNFFMTTYANPSVTSEERKDFLDYVAPQFVQAGPDSVLRMATMAMSSFLFVAWLDRRPDTFVSRSFYLNALSTMKDRIARSEGCADNDVLTSVLLLQMYEVCISRFPTIKTACSDELRQKRMLGYVNQSQSGRAHLEGALALIEHRGSENFRDEVGQGLLFAVRQQLIDEAFFTGEPLAEVVSTWAAHLDADTLSPSVQLDSINIDVANLSAATRKHTSLPPNIRSKMLSFTTEILCKAQNLQRRLQEWTTKLPPSWTPISIPKENIPQAIHTAGLYQDYCHVYPSISVASTWNKYRISLIRTHQIIHSLISLLTPTPTTLSLLTTSRTQIQFLSDEICASVPFTLGDKIKPRFMRDKRVQYPSAPGREVPESHYQMAPALGGFWLLGPLQVVMGLEGGLVREGQKMWVGRQLERIAFLYNIGK